MRQGEDREEKAVPILKTLKNGSEERNWATEIEKVGERKRKAFGVLKKKENKVACGKQSEIEKRVWWEDVCRAEQSETFPLAPPLDNHI